MGGLLTKDKPDDTAALRTAVIALNRSLSNEDRHAFRGALRNPSARLENWNPRFYNDYYRVLSRTRYEKTEAALDRSHNDSYVPGACDELLTQAEIQRHINDVNARRAWRDVEERLHGRMDGSFMSSLYLYSSRRLPLNLRHISGENEDSYREALVRLTQSPEWQREYPENVQNWCALLQKAIDSANEAADASRRRDQAVRTVNRIFLLGLQDKSYPALISQDLGFASVVGDREAMLYYSEKQVDLIKWRKCCMPYENLGAIVRVLLAIAAISKAVDTANLDLVYNALSNPDAPIFNLEKKNRVKYNRALAAVRRKKILVGGGYTLLTYMDIQECIDLVNRQCEESTEIIYLLRKLNDAVKENNRRDLTYALEEISSELQNPVYPDEESLYIILFKKCLEENHADGTELGLQDVESVTRTVALEGEEVQDVCIILRQINVALSVNDTLSVIEGVRALNIKVSDKRGQECIEIMKAVKRTRAKGNSCPYVRYVTSRGNESYLDLERSCYTWERLRLSAPRYISKEDIETIVWN